MRKIKTHAYKRSDSFGGWEPTTEIRTSDWRRIMRVLRAVDEALRGKHPHLALPLIYGAFDAMNRETKARKVKS